MSEVVSFPQRKVPFKEFLENLELAYDEGLLDDFVCIYSRKFKGDESHEGIVSDVNSYWFGKSSAILLGLCSMVNSEIIDFIKGR